MERIEHLQRRLGRLEKTLGANWLVPTREEYAAALGGVRQRLAAELHALMDHVGGQPVREPTEEVRASEFAEDKAASDIIERYELAQGIQRDPNAREKLARELERLAESQTRAAARVNRTFN